MSTHKLFDLQPHMTPQRLFFVNFTWLFICVQKADTFLFLLDRISDAWCGVVDSCPVMEGDDVTVACFGHYDWLSFYLGYNPIVDVNSTLQFVEKPHVSMFKRPWVPGFNERPPLATNLVASYTIRNVKAGDVIRSSCLIDFTFGRAERAYSDRNRYSVKPLQWNCTIIQPVHREYFAM